MRLLNRSIETGHCPVCYRTVELDSDGSLKAHHPGMSVHDWSTIFIDCPGIGRFPLVLVEPDCWPKSEFETHFALDERGLAGRTAPSSQNRASRSAFGRLLRAGRHALRGWGVVR